MIELAVRVGLGILAPAAVALALALLLHRGVKAAATDRYILATAGGVGFFFGYALMLLVPGFGQLMPASRWQWLPYIGLMSAVVGSLRPRGKLLWGLWCVLFAAAALLSCEKLAPRGEMLGLPRLASLAILAALMLSLTLLLEILPARLCGATLPAVLALVAAALMVTLLAAAVSARLAQLAGILFGVFAGCWLAALWCRLLPEAICGLIPPFVLLISGLAYVGCVDQDPPVLILLLLPAAPLAVWAAAAGPLAKLTGRAAIICQLALVAIPLAIIAAVAFFTAPPAW